MGGLSLQPFDCQFYFGLPVDLGLDSARLTRVLELLKKIAFQRHTAHEKPYLLKWRNELALSGSGQRRESHSYLLFPAVRMRGYFVIIDSVLEITSDDNMTQIERNTRQVEVDELCVRYYNNSV